MTVGSEWPAFRQSVLAHASGRPLATVLAEITSSVARATAVTTPDLDALFGVGATSNGPGERLAVPTRLATPDLLGRVHELLRDPDRRHTDGAYYTPPAVADGLAATVLAGRTDVPYPTVCDPAVGGGVFLLAAARALQAAGLDPPEIVGRHLWGLDIDPLAVATTRAALALWSAVAGNRPALVPDDHLCVGDFLTEPVPGWAPPPAGFDAVVGNPPFQGQLAASTARATDAAGRLRGWLGGAVHGYADTAALFLVAACMRAAPGGRVALVLPESVLASSHAAGAREAVRRRASLRGVWLPGARVFAANVRVCAPVIEVGGRSGTVVRRWTGTTVAPVGDVPMPTARPGDNQWAVIAARASGVPAVELAARGRPTLSSMAEATAGFRDQFYGLAGHIFEETPERIGNPRLVTAGAIDPARCRWGEVEVRFAGTRWRRPVVDLNGLDEENGLLAAWVRSRLVPKVLVATQTKVIEAVADPEGNLVPSVPVVAITPSDPDRVWHLAAVLLAPPVTAWAAERTWGTGLGAGTMRVSAKLLLEAPLPSDGRAWDEGAMAAAAVHDRPDQAGLDHLGTVMTVAYGVAPAHPVLSWWRSRCPRIDQT